MICILRLRWSGVQIPAREKILKIVNTEQFKYLSLLNLGLNLQLTRALSCLIYRSHISVQFKRFLLFILISIKITNGKTYTVIVTMLNKLKKRFYSMFLNWLSCQICCSIFHQMYKCWFIFYQTLSISSRGRYSFSNINQQLTICQQM